MSPKEEELEKRKELLSDYIIAMRKDLDKKLRAIDEVSESVGNFFDALHKLGHSNEKEMLDYRDRYQRFFLDQLGERKDYRLQLEFIFEQVKDFRLKIAEAKASRHERYQKIYEDTLNDVVFPIKTELVEMVRLESEVGKLMKEEVPSVVVEDKQPEEDIPVNETIEVITNIPAPEAEEVIKEDVPKALEQLKESEEVFIPVTLKDKPLATKTGKLLNNPMHISDGRKFSFKDERIPDLIGHFLLEHRCIFDYQLKVVQDFFRTSKCDRKIIFDGNANQLTTILYDLKKENYTTIFNNYLGELIETVFVKKGNTMQTLIVQKSLVADLKRGSFSRRTKEDSPTHLDVTSYLREKLKTPE